VKIPSSVHPPLAAEKSEQKGKEVAMGKLKINGCTHCRNGEIFIDHDQYGWYECCLQCGYSRDLPDIAQPADNEWKNIEKGGLPVRKGGSIHISKGV
jgi:hypothetical protein